MHQVSLETICPLKAFQLHYCPDNDAKSIVKHLVFLQKFAVLFEHPLCQHRVIMMIYCYQFRPGRQILFDDTSRNHQWVMELSHESIIRRWRLLHYHL